MFALVDCNAFYVSCERLFQPHLEGRPVIVLSSNDGCAIARSQEAKALGIRMGDPFFKIQELVKKHKVAVFSANFALYGDISSRVMDSLKAHSPSLEIYSIDEAFLDLCSVPDQELFSYGIHIKSIIKQWIGIPVSIGIGPTKTLAKVANHLAKGHPTGCFMLSRENTEEVLKTLPVHKVWGIGSRWAKKLSSFHLKTAFDLAHADISWLRKSFNVTLARTALELKGIPCLDLEEMTPLKKSMISSRSFGVPVTSFENLREAICFHASSLAEKLRQQKSKTSLISVTIKTSPFDKRRKFYSNTHLISLPAPSQDPSILLKAAVSALAHIYRPHLSYKKAGVRVLNLSPENQTAFSLFEPIEEEESAKRKALLRTIDQLNQYYGRGTLILASEGLHKSWQSKSSWVSPAFTSNWNQLMRVK